MRTLKTSEAASFLNVSPNTLRSWERRFGFPKPRRSPGQHRLYTYGDIAALRDALLAGLSISSAISVAREGLRSGLNPLLGSLAGFDPAGADDVMESTLNLRSIERSIEDVLLPALDHIEEKQGTESAPMAFAVRWAGDWLRRAARLAYVPAQRASVVIGDASRDEFDPDSVRIRALELVCVRSGPAPLRLPVRGLGSIAQAVAAHNPAAMVIAGRHASNDQVARWAYGVRATAGPVPVALFSRVSGSERVRAAGSARVLPDSPIEAHALLAEMVATPEAKRTVAAIDRREPAARRAVG